MKNNKKIGVKLLCYFGGLIIMTFGVAISVKSDMGVTPISSIPYTMTVVSGMDLGIATIPIIRIILMLVSTVFVAALLVGNEVKWITKIFGKSRDKMLGIHVEKSLYLKTTESLEIIG